MIGTRCTRRSSRRRRAIASAKSLCGRRMVVLFMMIVSDGIFGISLKGCFVRM